MDIYQLIERSKQSFEADPQNLPCANNRVRLVHILANEKLLVEPVWKPPIDHNEGFLYQDYIAKHPTYNSIFLREEVAHRLYQAANHLPSHLQLVVRAGHRPVEVQIKALETVIEKGLKEKNLRTYEAALEFARIFVDDPSIKIASHCCGSAVDVELYDIDKATFLDFGCFMNTESEEAYLHATSITAVQKDNRLILLTAMLQAGFAPTCVEWWHFSYGDTVWAYFYKEPRSLYKTIEMKF